MKITRSNPFKPGELNTMDLPITEEQIADWESGTLAQNAFPNLTAGQREFIMTGITEEAWEGMFGEDD